MLIGKEEDSFSFRKGPFQDRFGIAAGADDSVVPTAESFQAGGAIDVGNRGHILGINDLRKLLPCRLDLADCGHVCHGATGGHVRQNDRNRDPRPGRKFFFSIS